MTKTYTYTSEPHSAPRAKGGTLSNTKTITHNKNNADNENAVFVPLTLMSDPRVIRGNTQELARKVAVSRAQQQDIEKQKEEARQQLLRTQRQLESTQSRHLNPTAPYYNFVVRRFAQEDVELTNFLTEAEDMGPKKRDMSTEVDRLMERPRTPEYVPIKTGKDQSTQVEDVTELFHFDSEVQPMLEVIVRKTMEQALLEVEAEEEIVAIRKQIDDFETQKTKEEEWTKQYLEKQKEENRKMEDQKKAILFKKKKELRLKNTIAGLQMMRQITPSMEENVAKRQYDQKKWKTSDVIEFEINTMPKKIIPEANKRKNYYHTAQDVLDELLIESDIKAASIGPPTTRMHSPLHKR